MRAMLKTILVVMLIIFGSLLMMGGCAFWEQTDAAGGLCVSRYSPGHANFENTNRICRDYPSRVNCQIDKNCRWMETAELKKLQNTKSYEELKDLATKYQLVNVKERSVPQDDFDKYYTKTGNPIYIGGKNYDVVTDNYGNEYMVYKKECSASTT